jgi:hypothetical protein
VALTLPGFVAKTVETKPNGRRYMVAEHANTKVVVSVTLEETRSGTPASSCRHSLEGKTKHPPSRIQDVRFSRSGDVDVMRYAVAEFRGQRINQESLFACQFYGIRQHRAASGCPTRDFVASGRHFLTPDFEHLRVPKHPQGLSRVVHQRGATLNLWKHILGSALDFPLAPKHYDSTLGNSSQEFAPNVVPSFPL